MFGVKFSIRVRVRAAFRVLVAMVKVQRERMNHVPVSSQLHNDKRCE